LNFLYSWQLCIENVGRCPQRQSHRPLHVASVGLGLAEVDQQAVAKILGDMAVHPNPLPVGARE
jgi:hypothetical protein